jgi:hypothetical protein
MTLRCQPITEMVNGWLSLAEVMSARISFRRVYSPRQIMFYSGGNVSSFDIYLDRRVSRGRAVVWRQCCGKLIVVNVECFEFIVTRVILVTINGCEIAVC